VIDLNQEEAMMATVSLMDEDSGDCFELSTHNEDPLLVRLLQAYDTTESVVYVNARVNGEGVESITEVLSAEEEE
jgi:hypothetical protein